MSRWPSLTTRDHETARIIATVPQAIEYLKQTNININNALDALDQLKIEPTRDNPHIPHQRACSATRSLARVCGVAAVLIDQLLRYTPESEYVHELQASMSSILDHLGVAHASLTQLEVRAAKDGFATIPEEFLNGPCPPYLSNAYLRQINPAWEEYGIRDPLMVPTCWIGVPTYSGNYRNPPTKKRKRGDVDEGDRKGKLAVKKEDE